jgi:hypothetical protein
VYSEFFYTKRVSTATSDARCRLNSKF